MKTIFEKGKISITDDNTIVLGASRLIKKEIESRLEDYQLVDDTFSFLTNNIAETLENLNISKIKELESISEVKIKDLTFDQYYLAAILIRIITCQKGLIIDDCLSFLSDKSKQYVYKYAKKYDKKLIIFSNQILEMFSDDLRIVIIHNDDLAIKGTYKQVLREEKILKRLGYKLPFAVDLSTQLKLFKVINKICFSDQELEEALWK